jgi:hypothetical protein
MSSGQACEFPMAPELRRSAVYALAGMLMAAGLVAWLQQQAVPGVDQELLEKISLLAALAALLMLLVFRWRLRVDEAGISRRRVVGWDLWSWDDFRNGRVAKVNRLGFYRHPAKFLLWRTLSLGSLAIYRTPKWSSG